MMRYPFGRSKAILGIFGLLNLSPLGLFAQTNFPVELEEGIWRVGMIQQTALSEASGLVASERHPEVYWSHNDGGNPQFLFALNRQGEHLGAFELKGARLIDWEAITIDQQGNLYLADTGTNGIVRSHSAIHRVKEPDPGDRWGPAAVEQSWLIRFPGEREDCEAMFISDGYLYLISKYPFRGRVTLYRFPLSSSAESTLLEVVTQIPVRSPVSDAALSADKTILALVEEEGVAVYFVEGNLASAGEAPFREVEYENTRMEGIAFAEDGLLTVSEQDPEVLLFNGPELRGVPILVEGLASQSAFTGQLVRLAVDVEGPGLSFAWYRNGVILPRETASTLTLRAVTFESAGTYEVVVSNFAGHVRSSAELTVLEKQVDLRITEIMSSESEASVQTEDWWELTSFDLDPVDLSGWKFNDSTGGLDDAFTIPNGVVINPGESIVFVENLTPAQFRAWWGEANVPPTVQIITYSGAELSFSAIADSLRLWESGSDTVYARVDFGVAERGVSFGYDPETGVFGGLSRVGVHGAFQAAAGTDLGSPGRITGASPAVLEARNSEDGMRLKVVGTEATAEYEVETADDLHSGRWAATGVIVREGSELVVEQSPGESRFYRLRKR